MEYNGLMIIGGMAMDRILGHPGTAHAVEESRLVVGVGRVQLVPYILIKHTVSTPAGSITTSILMMLL